MGLGGTGCRAGAGGALDRPEVEPPGLRDTFKSGQDVTRCSHVAGFLLHPNNLARVGMLVDGRGNFRAGQRVELVEEENSGIRVFATAAFGAQLVANFAAGNQNATRVPHFAVGNEWQEARFHKLLDVGASVWMAQHALGRKNDQRLTPWGVCCGMRKFPPSCTDGNRISFLFSTNEGMRFRKLFS